MKRVRLNSPGRVAVRLAQLALPIGAPPLHSELQVRRRAEEMQMVGNQYVKPDLPGIGRLPCRANDFVNRRLGQPLLATAGAGGQKHDGGLPKMDVDALSRSSATDIFVWDIADHGRRMGLLPRWSRPKGSTNVLESRSVRPVG